MNAHSGRVIAMARAPKLALVQPSLPAAALRGERTPDDAVLGADHSNLKIILFKLSEEFQFSEMLSANCLNCSVSESFARTARSSEQERLESRDRTSM